MSIECRTHVVPAADYLRNVPSCSFGRSAHNGWMFSPIESVLFHDRAHGNMKDWNQVVPSVGRNTGYNSWNHEFPTQSEDNAISGVAD